ncbi:hypothetical protein HYPSUDRAFT_907138 [Hypholoma sublateritium FD-334 SS-4]|uniref:F-box domain-containing protein n=1 Tax=Hypholoma sublateritium (strain FD-334 SS-4) TaxID=945553 RepID=A0A0D2NQS7_HYPSF|nr:hypothetical protein HYPSUDRAFT_907138 [Hypholoma sublateritium FD-334 SS-4]
MSSQSPDAAPPSGLTWHLKNIPPEIWQYIFQIVVSSENDTILEDVYGSIWGRNIFPMNIYPSPAPVSISPRTPSTLSQVCGLWKDISFALPQIWSTLKVIAAPRTNVNVQRVENLISRRLSRAPSTPLTISIIANHDKEVVRALLRSLLPFRAQWNTLHLQIPLLELAEFSSLRSGDVPLLTTVKLIEYTYGGVPRVLQGIDVNRESISFHICNISPALRRLCITSHPLTLFGISFCSRLHEVNIQQSPSETWSNLNFLEACPQLRILTLSGYGVTLGIPLPTVCLPELVTLNLEHPIGRERLLQKMNLPRLRSVWVGGRCNGDFAINIMQNTNEMLKRSGVGSLEILSLDLETYELDTHTLLEFLKANPSLRKLSINDGWDLAPPVVTSEFFVALTLPDQDNLNSSTMEIVCPQLTHISFSNCSALDDVSVFRCLHSRSPGRYHRGHTELGEEYSALEVAEISCRGSLELSHNILMQVHQLRLEGLVIDMTGDEQC